MQLSHPIFEQCASGAVSPPFPSGWRDRHNECLYRLPRLHRGQRIGRVLEVIQSTDHLAPRHAITKPRGELHGAMEVMVLRTPTAVNLNVLAIDLPVRMDLDRSVVGVVAADDDASAV